MNKRRIVMIDYGAGNVHSVANALKKLSYEVKLTDKKVDIQNASHVIFPGVGAIKHCMESIHNKNLTEAIQDSCKNKFFLGICVGMQALMQSSEENNHVECLHIFTGNISHFKNLYIPNDVKIPHIGYNNVSFSANHKIWNSIVDSSKFYYVHSYCLPYSQNDQAIGITNYGVDFISAIATENCIGVQFHPEKSGSPGLQLLDNFLQLS